MPLRFYSRTSILPGVRLNLSRSGPSLSLGVRGVHVTVGNRRGTRYSVGIPGTGLGWYKTVGPHHSAPPMDPNGRQGVSVGRTTRGWLLLPLQVAWFFVHVLLWIALRVIEVALLVAAGLFVAVFAGTMAGLAASTRRR